MRKQPLVDQRRTQVRDRRRRGNPSLPFVPEADPRGDVGAFPERIDGAVPLVGRGSGGCRAVWAAIPDEGTRPMFRVEQALLGQAVVDVLGGVAGDAEQPLRVDGSLEPGGSRWSRIASLSWRNRLLATLREPGAAVVTLSSKSGSISSLGHFCCFRQDFSVDWRSTVARQAT